MRAFAIKASDIERCPQHILRAGHYFSDGTCLCPRTVPQLLELIRDGKITWRQYSVGVSYRWEDRIHFTIVTKEMHEVAAHFYERKPDAYYARNPEHTQPVTYGPVALTAAGRFALQLDDIKATVPPEPVAP